LTYPLVGNYGVPDPSIKDEDGISKYFESSTIQIRGLVVHELSLTASHWNLSMTLDEWMYNEKIPGIPVLTTIELADSFVKTLEWLKYNHPTVEPIEPYDKFE
jgi:carbamoyl-phosphate synthase small subunit